MFRGKNTGVEEDEDDDQPIEGLRFYNLSTTFPTAPVQFREVFPGWMDGWMDGWMGGWVDGWVGDEWFVGWMIGWMHGWIVG